MTILVEFKSTDEYFWDEQLNVRNWTIRDVNMDEKKFQELYKIKGIVGNEEAYIKITHATKPEHFFIRSIRHIMFWKEDTQCGITWRH